MLPQGGARQPPFQASTRVHPDKASHLSPYCASLSLSSQPVRWTEMTSAPWDGQVQAPHGSATI